MRDQSFPLLFVSVIILAAAFAFPARATVYSPGVIKDQSVTFTSIAYTANSTLPPGIGQVGGTSSLTNTVTSVNANNVTIRQDWTFNNGTNPRSNTLSGLVDTGQGNLTFFVIAGGLTAGDPINQASQGQNFFTTINQTVTRSYAGATRAVNVLNFTQTFQQYYLKGVIYNDAITGFLLEFSEAGHLPNSPTTSVTFSFQAVATSTNVWSPSTTADFSFDAIPASSTSILPGQSVSFHLNLTSFLGFTGAVTISAGLIASNSTVTNHVTVSSSTSSVTVPSHGSATETLTVSSGSSTPVGLYILTVNATDGTITHRDHLTVKVVSPTPPDFTIFANPAALSIPQGSSQISTITLASQGGLSGSVTVYATSSDVTSLSVSPTITSVTLTPGGTASFDLTMNAASAAPIMTYQVTVAASIISTFHTVTIFPTVTANQAPDFSIIATPSFLIIPQGHAGNTNVTLTSLNSFAGSVTLAYNSNAVYALDTGPASGTLISGGTEKFEVQLYVPRSTPLGLYDLNVTGTASNIHKVVIPVQVISSSLPGFSLTIAPSSVSVSQGASGTALVTLTSLNGFQGTVTLKTILSHLPTSFSLTSLTVPAGGSMTSTLTVSPAISTPTGTYSVDVEGQTNSTGAYDSNDTTITVTPGVQPGIILTQTSINLSFAVGSHGTDNLMVAGTNGFSGIIDFSASVTSGGTPSTALTATCNSVTLTTTTTPKTSTCNFAATAPGIYSVVVSGSSGSPSASSQVTYSVTVSKASPGLSTTLSQTSITTGQSVTDAATLTGGFSPGGFVTYEMFSGSSCAGAPTNVGTMAIVTNGVVPSSIPQTFNTAGDYSWYAVYSGDANNDFAISPCEPLAVNAPYDYMLTATPTTGSINPGQTFTATITATLTSGVAVPVALRISYSPDPTVCLPVYGSSPCGTFSLSPTTIMPTSTGATSTLTVATTVTVPPGIYSLTITGLPSGASSASATITLTVNAAPSPDVTISSSSTPISASTGSPATSTITVGAVHGFTGIVTLSISAPSGITCTLDHTTLQGYGTATLTCTSKTANDYTVTVTATGGTTPHSATQTFHVAAAPSPAAPAPSTPWLIYTIIIIVVVTAVAGSLVVVTRRKNP